jgi:hypothetical protein
MKNYRMLPATPSSCLLRLFFSFDLKKSEKIPINHFSFSSLGAGKCAEANDNFHEQKAMRAIFYLFPIFTSNSSKPSEDTSAEAEIFIINSTVGAGGGSGNQ